MLKSPQAGTDTIRLGQIVNEQPRPRVLVTGFREDQTAAVAAVAANVAPTVTVELYLPNVDLSEYDCVITGDDYLQVEPDTHPQEEQYHGGYADPPLWWKWRQKFPAHISIFRILMDLQSVGPLADLKPSEGAGESLGHEAIYLDSHVPGRHIRYAQGLPAELTELVKRHLAPAAQVRKDHITMSVRRPTEDRDQASVTDEDSFRLRPLLYGPSDEILAATYERSTEASVWLLPLDLLGDLRSWLVAAFREWHDLYPKRFPAVADWTHSMDWATPAESRLMDQLQDADDTLEKARAEHEATVAALEEALSSARESGDDYERALLTATGTPLEAAVSRALSELGFEVQNMDDVWPEDARREDYRITDPDEPGWLALGEAKGFTKGVSESGIINLMKYAALYASEQKQTPGHQWYIANHFRREDPATRQRALNGRDDVIEAFSSADGLLIDTRELFAVLMEARRRPECGAEIRAAMRAQTGRLTRQRCF